MVAESTRSSIPRLLAVVDGFRRSGHGIRTTFLDLPVPGEAVLFMDMHLLKRHNIGVSTLMGEVGPHG